MVEAQYQTGAEAVVVAVIAAAVGAALGTELSPEPPGALHALVPAHRALREPRVLRK